MGFLSGLFSKPKVPKPKDPLDLASQQSGKLLGYYGAEVPKWMQLQEQLGPQLMAQMFGQTGQYLGGVGLQALQLSTGQQAGETLGQLRAGELGQMTGQAPLTRGVMQGLSPEQAAVVQGFATEAERARASAQGVSPQERRGYEQQAREGFQASGRLGGNLGIVSEAMGREDVMARKRAEAAQAGARSYEAAQGFYTQPGLSLLSKAPLSYQAGQQTLGMALTGGPAASGQFDYNAPLGFSQQRASALDKAAMAQFQADQQYKSQMGGLLMKGIGLAAAPFTGGLSAGLGLGSGGFSGIMSGLGQSVGQGIRGGFGTGQTVNSNAGYIGSGLQLG
jgi:hypothetical protein